MASGVRKGTEAKKIRDRHKGTDAQGFRCHTGSQAKNKGRSRGLWRYMASHVGHLSFALNLVLYTFLLWTTDRTDCRLG